MKAVKDMTDLEFEELIHQVFERIERTNQSCVSVKRPFGITSYIVNGNDEYCCPRETSNENPEECYMTVHMVHVSSRIKL